MQLRNIAVAGGGIVGLSIAWRLAQEGARVITFDQSKMGGEASWAGAGMLAPGGEVEEPSRLAALALESRRLYPDYVRELERISSIEIDYQERGALELAYSEEEHAQLQGRAQKQAELGIRSKPLTPAQVVTFWPRVRGEGLVSARFYPDDAIVNPRQVVEALRVACEQSGVSLQQDCAVTRGSVSADGVCLQTARGPVACDAVVIAAGAWSGWIPVEGVPPLPASEPVRGHLIGYQQPAQTCETIVRRGHTYLLQRANGLLIAGASVERVGFNRDIDAGITASLASAASSVFPHLAETTPSEVWTGFRPGSGDLQIGAWGSERVLLAYGHYRNGILLAPVTAKLIAAEVSASFEKR